MRHNEVCAVNDIDHFIVESDAPDDKLRLLAQAGTTLLRAAAPI